MERVYIFEINDVIEMQSPKGHRVGKIVDRILPLSKPDMDLIRRYNLKNLPITRATVQRLIVEFCDNKGRSYYSVFPDNPVRRVENTLYLTGDVMITKRTKPEQVFRPL